MQKSSKSVTEALREIISIQKSNICRGSNILDVFALQINDEETLCVKKRNDRSIEKKNVEYLCVVLLIFSTILLAIFLEWTLLN